MGHSHITGFNVFHCNRRPHARVDVYHHGSSGCCGSYGCGGSIWGPQNFGAGLGLGMGYGLMNWLGGLFGFGGMGGYGMGGYGMGGYGMGGYGMGGYGMGGYGMGNGWLSGLLGNRTNPYGQGNDDKDQEKLKEYTDRLKYIKDMPEDCHRGGALIALAHDLEDYKPDATVYGKENEAWKDLIKVTADLLRGAGLKDKADKLEESKSKPSTGTSTKSDETRKGGDETLTPEQRTAKANDDADAALLAVNTLGDNPKKEALDAAIKVLKDAKDNPDLVDNDKKKALQDEIDELEAKKSELDPADDQEDEDEDVSTSTPISSKLTKEIREGEYKTACETLIAQINEQVANSVILHNVHNRHDSEIKGEIETVDGNNFKVKVKDSDGTLKLTYKIKLEVSSGELYAIVTQVIDNSRNQHVLKDEKNRTYKFDSSTNKFERYGSETLPIVSSGDAYKKNTSKYD